MGQQLQDKVILDVANEEESDLSMVRQASVSMNIQKQMIDDLAQYKRENIRLSQEQTKQKSKEDELYRQIAQLQSQLQDERNKHQNVLIELDTMQHKFEDVNASNNEKSEKINALQLEL